MRRAAVSDRRECATMQRSTGLSSFVECQFSSESSDD
eukprot:SAG11_NODE_24484_length_372_cov_2.087912_1_plen_36_part_01